MAIYKYKAITERGDVIKGFKEADSEDDVIRMLKKTEYYPISVEKETQLKWFTRKVSKRDLAIFCRQFSAMLNAGISIVNSLEVLEHQIENRKLIKAIHIVNQDVHKGKPISSAMKSHERFFPDLLISMMEVGEASGNLDLLMERMAFHYEKENRIENKIKNSLIYPAILSIISVIVVILLSTIIIPTYIEIFDNEILLPWPTKFMLYISKWLTNYWYVLSILFAILITAIKYYGKRDEGILFFDSLKIRIPIIKKLTTKIITSRFAKTMSILLSSGIPLLQALDVARKVVGNKVVSCKLVGVKDHVRKGVEFSEAMKATGIFDPIVYSMIKVGEESGTMEKLLGKTADYFDEEVEYLMEKVTILLEPILIVLMAIIIGFVVISMTMPMLDMIDSIQV